MRKLSFVIPCYKSEMTIGHVVSEICESVKSDDDYEIICVNDCSPDDVYAVLKELSSHNEHIKVINLAKNFGQHNALMAGYHYVSGDIIISLDDDGQTDPRECYKLIDALDDQTDVAYAKYFKKKHSIFRNLGTQVNHLMNVTLIGMPHNVYSTSYFAAKRFVIDEMIRYTNPYTFPSGLICRTTRNITNINITHHKREFGRSGYTLKKLLNLWLNGATQFSVEPLRIATHLGVVTAVIGFIYAVYTVIRKIIFPGISAGYSSMMCVLLVVGGIIMVLLGLIGEYIGRIYICLNNSPQYVVKETINCEQER